MQEPTLKMSLTQDKTQNRSLGYYLPKIRPRYPKHSNSKFHSNWVSLLQNSMCKYLEEDTLYIGRSDLEGKMSEGWKRKGRGATYGVDHGQNRLGCWPRVLNMVQNPNSRCLVLQKWVLYKPISPSTLLFMLCEPTLTYFAIWTPKVNHIYLQKCFCLLRRLEERKVDVLVYAQFFF